MKKAKLSELTIKRLREVEQFILAEPRRFDMWSGVQKTTDVRAFSGGDRILQEPPCGTMCCVAGAAFIIGKKIELNKPYYFDWISISSYAINKFFHFTYHQADLLFFPTNWPKIFKDAYDEADTPMLRASVGVARIEHFIATNGAE